MLHEHVLDLHTVDGCEIQTPVDRWFIYPICELENHHVSRVNQRTFYGYVQ